MATYLDTNYLVRFLTEDVKTQAVVAKEVIKKEIVFIPTVVFAETIYVLEKYYNFNKEKMCPILLSVIKQPNISSPEFIPLALEIYKSENISFYDSLLLSEVVTTHSQLRTFDVKLKKIYSKYLKN